MAPKNPKNKKNQKNKKESNIVVSQSSKETKKTLEERSKLKGKIAKETAKKPKNYSVDILIKKERLRKQVSEKIPHNYHYSKIKIGDKESTIAVGGRPGCLESQKASYDIKKAKSQIKSLVEDRGIDVIVSMDSKKLIKNAVKELRKEGINVVHEGYSFRLSDSVHKKNIQLFEKLGKYINEGKSIYIHCRHGAHRAPSTTVGALLASGKVKSLGEAFYLAGLKLNNYTKNRKRENQHIGQLARYAASKGIPVETTMLNDGKIYTINFKAPDGELNFYKSGKAPREVAGRTNAEELAKQNQPVDETYPKRLKEITKETKTADIKTLSTIDIANLRASSKVLNKEKEEKTPKDKAKNLRNETSRRIEAFTSGYKNNWYTIDYQKIDTKRDADKKTHEYFTGLGEVLSIDPDIKHILVNRGGRITKGHKGIVTQGKHKGRLAFLDENNEYIATHSGDKFKILKYDPTNLEDKKALTNYIKSVETNNKQRTKSKTNFISFEENHAKKIANDPAYENPEKHIQYKKGAKLENSNVSVETLLAAEKECIKGSKNIEKIVARKNYIAVVEYVAKKVEIPASVILAVPHFEVGHRFDPDFFGDRRLALGMGQFHIAGWRWVKKQPQFKEVMKQVSDQDPNTLERGRSILADIMGVALILKKSFDEYAKVTGYKYKMDYTSKPERKVLANLRWRYHVPSYWKALHLNKKGSVTYTKAISFYKAKANSKRWRSRFGYLLDHPEDEWHKILWKGYDYYGEKALAYNAKLYPTKTG